MSIFKQNAMKYSLNACGVFLRTMRINTTIEKKMKDVCLYCGVVNQSTSGQTQCSLHLTEFNEACHNMCSACGSCFKQKCPNNLPSCGPIKEPTTATQPNCPKTKYDELLTRR